MFILISWQTYEGSKISVDYQIIEATQFLLWHQIKYALTERFCQDPLENWFARQRSLGSKKNNSGMFDFGYNNNATRNQKYFKPIANDNSHKIAWTDGTRPCWKPKQEWKFKCKVWIKKTHQLLLLPKYSKTQVNSLLNVSVLFLFLSL